MIALTLSGVGLTMLLDRFVLKRTSISKVEIGQHKVENGLLRVPFSFKTKFKRLKGATVEYTLRDKRNPRTVIAGGYRTLEHSSPGFNSEYLDIPANNVTPDGVWVIHVKILHGDSLFNPLYRIFPLSRVVEKEFHIQIKR